MEKIGEMEEIVAAVPADTAITVEVVQVMSQRDSILGYYVGLFGPMKLPKTRSLYCHALYPDTRHFDQGTDAGLHDTPEEAMAAWEAGTPIELPDALGARHGVPSRHVKTINEQGLYRVRVI